jgi:hypothetical protein
VKWRFTGFVVDGYRLSLRTQAGENLDRWKYYRFI